MTDLIAISDARANLPDLVDKIDDRFDRAVITVNGKPKVVMLSIDELESLEETAEVLRVPYIKQDIEKSHKQFKKGESISQKEFGRLPKPDRDKIKKKLLAIAENPYAGKKLVGELAGIFSMRAWPYRILYEVNLKKKQVHKIAQRQGVYKS